MTAKKNPGKRGRPTENVLKVEGNWKDAIKTALSRGKPPKKAMKPKKGAATPALVAVVANCELSTLHLA